MCALYLQIQLYHVLVSVLTIALETILHVVPEHIQQNLKQLSGMNMMLENIKLRRELSLRKALFLIQ